MLDTVSIKILPDGYTVLARARRAVQASSNVATGSVNLPDRALSPEQWDVINCQQWQLKTPPFSELVSGQRWDELALSARYVEALGRVSVASSKLARRLGERCYAPINHLSIFIEAGRVEASLQFDQRMILSRPTSVVRCQYQWDENRQLKPLEFLEGGADTLPAAFAEDFKEASFGRYGLLARLLELSSQTPPIIDDMGAMRWA